jgi:histidinol-phosphate/aromatic aminotransferase/cobyric acid decarboxylase-like protein
LQYKEYERSAQAAGFDVVPHDHPHASVTCVINPNNPTGEYFPIVDLKTMIETSCSPGSHVIVDESMQPWVGPGWREDSLLQQQGWVTEMLEKHGIHVFIMHSWTKIWSCTGVRLGSVVAPTVEVAQRIKGRQVPWSVNTMALEFLSEVVKDDDYMQRTWELTPQWRQQTADAITARFPSWTILGKPFLSWLWCDTGDEGVALEAVRLAKAAGTPVRHGKPGYDMPTMVRVAVREPKHLQTLLAAWEPLQASGP